MKLNNPSRTWIVLAVLLLAASSWFLIVSQPASREEAIALWLGKYEPSPSIFSPPISDRAFWRGTPELLKKSPPVIIGDDPNALMEFINEGTDQECKYDDGQWLPTINSCLQKIVLVRWGETAQFDREFTDLHATDKGANLARTCYLLGERLDKKTVEATIAAIQAKVIQPFLHDSVAYQTRVLSWGLDMCPWLEAKNNWNAVCVANIVYAALAIEPNIQKRAQLIALAEEPIKDYFDTFEDDGYLSSGIRYWNYGFAHLILLAERLVKATGGHIDLFKTPGLVEMARFRDRWEIGRDGDAAFYPLFADNSNPTSIRQNVIFLAARRFGTSSPDDKPSVWGNSGTFTDLLLNPPPVPVAPNALTDDTSRRTYFASAGALIARNPADLITLAVKGGTNSEEHNHNDVGSYTLFLGNEVVCGDIGTGAYSPEYFGAKRYNFDVASSYGHPLPVINNQLQNEGTAAVAHVINRQFSDGRDSITYDIRGAYLTPGLIKAERKVEFVRGKKATLTVTDSFESAIPISFETAIITPNYASVAGGGIRIFVGSQIFDVQAVPSGPIGMNMTRFKKDSATIRRIGLFLSHKAKTGFISYTVAARAISTDLPKVKLNREGTTPADE